MRLYVSEAYSNDPNLKKKKRFCNKFMLVVIHVCKSLCLRDVFQLHWPPDVTPMERWRRTRSLMPVGSLTSVSLTLTPGNLGKVT